MSIPQSREAALDHDSYKETQTFGVHLAESRTFSLKLCSHAAVARRSRRQFTCMTKDPDDQSSSIWRFLSWVAYCRTLAARSQITDDERLRCPMIWCRCVLGDQNMLLEHVFTCAHLSDGRYWCFHCQKEESFAPFQCKQCQVPAFGERLSVKVKRLFRSLGTKPHHKDRQAFDSSALPNGTSCTFRNQCFEYLPDYRDKSPMATEMDNHQVLRKCRDDCVSAVAELNGCDVLPAELSGKSSSTSALQDPSLGFNPRCTANDEGTASAPYYASMDAMQTQVLPTPLFDVREPLSQFRLKSNKTRTSGDSLPQLQSPVSPQIPEWMMASYTDTMSESPTNTDFSGMSFFTKTFESDISPPSTRNSTMQSFSQSSVTAENPVECPPILPIMHDIIEEKPNSIPERGFPSAEPDTFQSDKRQVSTHTDSPRWLTPKDLLNEFWKVLILHVTESSERLSMLSDRPVITELLSMTADTIALTGFSAWQGTSNGYSPTTIRDLYALVHVAYACAFVIYDGQVEDHVKRLFAHSLSIDTEALSDEDKITYTNIVWSIWSPGVGDSVLHLFAGPEDKDRPSQPPNLQSRFKGKASLNKAGFSGCGTQSSHLDELVCTMGSQSHRINEVNRMLEHFLDICEGLSLWSGVRSAGSNPPHGCRDDNFIRTIKENITTPLMKGYFQSTPSLEAFIEVVLEIERLVNVGQITTVRELEVGLIWAGRSTAQSMTLYELFLHRVKELCHDMYHQLRQTPPLQNENEVSHEGIQLMWINLAQVISETGHPDLDQEYWHPSGTAPDKTSSRAEQEVTSLEGNTDNSEVEELSHSNTVQAELSRSPAIKRKRPSSSSSASTPEFGPSPMSSASSKTLSESSESEYSRCSFCPFRPGGERKWHKRTMRRHRLLHLDPDHKEAHLCNYQGCKSSFTRADNLRHHVRVIHQRNKRQCGLAVSLGTAGLNSPPETDSRSGY